MPPAWRRAGNSYQPYLMMFPFVREGCGGWPTQHRAEQRAVPGLAYASKRYGVAWADARAAHAYAKDCSAGQ